MTIIKYTQFKAKVGGLFTVVLLGTSCVPKAQYEDQREQLNETKTKLREAQKAQSECDPEVFAQLKEQAQSLDILTQELVDRNTELSREVNRLRKVEVENQKSDIKCAQMVAKGTSDLEAKLARTRATYEDLVQDLQGRVKELEREVAAQKKILERKAANRTPPQKNSSKKK